MEEREKAVEENGGSSSNLRLAAEHWCACTTTHHRVSVEVTNGKSVNLGKEGRREDEKTPRSTLYTALILDSNGCSRVVAVLVIASRLHTARVQRNVSPVDDNVAVAEGVLAAFHLSTSGGVTLYFRIPKRPLVNSMGSSSWWQLNGQYNKRGNNCERIFQNFEVYTYLDILITFSHLFVRSFVSPDFSWFFGSLEISGRILTATTSANKFQWNRGWSFEILFEKSRLYSLYYIRYFDVWYLNYYRRTNEIIYASVIERCKTMFMTWIFLIKKFWK